MRRERERRERERESGGRERKAAFVIALNLKKL